MDAGSNTTDALKRAWEFSLPDDGFGEPYWHYTGELIVLSKTFRALLDNFGKEGIKALIDSYPMPEQVHIYEMMADELRFWLFRHQEATIFNPGAESKEINDGNA